MTQEATALSAASQQSIAAMAETEAKAARGKAKYSLGWSLGAFALAAVVATVFPPAIVPGLIALAGATVGVLSATYAAGHAINEQLMKKTKQESAEEGFVKEAQKRASRLHKMFTRSSRISDYGLYAALTTAATGFLLAATAPVMWPLYTVSIFVMGGAALVSSATREPSKGADKMSRVVQSYAESDGMTLKQLVSSALQPPAAAPAMPAPANDFSKAANDFSKAANGNTPPAAPAEPAEPVKTATPPKP